MSGLSSWFSSNLDRRNQNQCCGSNRHCRRKADDTPSFPHCPKSTPDCTTNSLKSTSVRFSNSSSDRNMGTYLVASRSRKVSPNRTFSNTSVKWRVSHLVLMLCLVLGATTTSAGETDESIEVKQSNYQRQAYRTAYGCEGSTLSITCEPGHVINVIRANYGRFSITICNTQGNTQWSVNCQSRRSNKVLTDRCSGRQHCEVGVSSATFGDPCPGTFKYIEVQYSCGIATTTTTTARPRPAWEVYSSRPPLFLPPSLNNSLNVPTTTTTPTTTSLRTTSKLLSTTQPTTKFITTVQTPSTTKHQSNEHAKPSELDGKEDSVVVDNRKSNNDKVRPSSSTSSTTTTSTTSTFRPVTESRIRKPISDPPKDNSNTNYDVPWCPPTFGRGLYWNWTRGGEVAVQSCPGGATGWARRKCLMSGWSGPADLGDCRSAWLTALESRANSQDAVLSVADDLATVTAIKALYGGDLTTAAKMISTLAKRMGQDISGFPDPRQKQAHVTELLATALSTASSLLAAGMTGPWGDLAPHERRHTVTELLVGLEEATFLLADALPRDTQAAYFDSHVLASARVITADGSYVQFPSLEDQALDWTFADTVILPPEAIIDNSERSATKAIFLTYRHLEGLLTPRDEALGSYNGNNVSRIVNSRIVSASLGHGRHIQLPKPVTIIFSLLRQDNVTNPVCAFWDYTTASWSDEGCMVVAYNRSHVTCQCDHLTNFAVIMEKQTTVPAAIAESNSKIIVVVGCIICLICLVASLFMFTLFRNPSPCSAIQHQLCMCLLVAELVFVIGIWRTNLPILCGIVAGVLCYTILAAFSWICLEGFQLYQSVARAVEYTSLRLRWYHYTMAYFLPLLIVSTSAIIDPFSFGTSEYCWLSTDNYFVFALVGPALVLVLVHLSLLVAAVVHTCKLSPNDPLKSKEMARLSSSKSWLRGSTILLLLMSFTWTFGLLYLHQPSMSMAISFCVCNSLTGGFILVYYCCRNQKFLPRLCRHLNNAKGQESSIRGPTSGHLISGPTSTLGSGTSLRPGPGNAPNMVHSGYQTRTLATPRGLNISSNSSNLQNSHQGMDSKYLQHQSLPRHQHMKGMAIHSNTTTTNTNMPIITTTHAVSSSALLNANNDEEVSYKSFSRDSGHGGSEQEDSPRTHWTNTTGHQNNLGHNQMRYNNSLSNDLKNAFLNKHARMNASDGNSNKLNLHNGNNLHMSSANAYPYIEGVNKQGMSVPNSYTTNFNPALAAVMKDNGRYMQPYNHTYMEIEHDPVYEEIERERWSRLNGNSSEIIQVSDLSDEDGKRMTPSDMGSSRQSSRSYSDSRPLLPFYSQQHQQQLRQQQPYHLLQQEIQAQQQYALEEENRMRNFEQEQILLQQQASRENLMTVAVLNGEQVVCRLTSPNQPMPQTSCPSLVGSPSSGQYQQLPNLAQSPQSSNHGSGSPTSPSSNGVSGRIVISSAPHLVHNNQQTTSHLC